MKFIEIFSGIGGMGYGLMKAGFECVGFCEVNKYAHAAFNLLHNSEKKMWEGWDIRDVTDENIRSIKRERGEISLISGGFPCQSFSIAGSRRGFEDTRGTLIFEIFRFAFFLRPKYLLLENVKGLISHDNGETFKIMLKSFDELGYDAEWQVLNSKNFNVPQNRERLYIIGHLRGLGGRKVFPFTRKSKMDIQIEGRLDVKGFDILKRVYNTDGISPTLNTSKGGSRVARIITKDSRISYLTPLEYFRLQSFPDEWYHKLKNKKYSNSQFYKLAGNAVTPNVTEEIGKRLIQKNGGNKNE